MTDNYREHILKLYTSRDLPWATTFSKVHITPGSKDCMFQWSWGL